ncbi:hypothetical protein N7462_010201 [Penicillium macrosclerotiorum]|uniref:uncharacterized protein n=1 Tax=Penicillium macrosclerotiorum TaxID=303699 RepID=UPI002547B78D|nr:uncharacterized protein N7462_010201 [Penicillium macrosclerotiorum]KAJ5669131.1 hypothetical protein N7462_010201 [Penicillium macrosclerotiorum]
MAMSTAAIISLRSFLFFILLLVSIGPSHASNVLTLALRSSSSCPSSYDSCGGSLPDNFCCPSSSTCVSLDSDSSAICCPSGSNCDYISPITCDVQDQNATAYPKSTVKTTRLNDTLPSCGSSCCPFGYTCQGDSICAINKKTSATETATSSTASSTATDIGATFTSVSSPSASNDNSTHFTSSCSSYPTKALAAGFFPGAFFGGMLALIITYCVRRRAQKKELQRQTHKIGHHWSQRSSSGAVVGISSPIASEDNSYRTDFLLRPDSRRTSVGGRSTRSVLHRTGTRVKSLFFNNPKLDKDVPPLPGYPPVTPPRQRQPSTESIKIYSPPGAAFAQSRKFLGPEPYPGTIARPDTTFTDLVQAVGFSDAKGNPTFKVTDTSKE